MLLISSDLRIIARPGEERKCFVDMKDISLCYGKTHTLPPRMRQAATPFSDAAACQGERFDTMRGVSLKGFYILISRKPAFHKPLLFKARCFL